MNANGHECEPFRTGGRAALAGLITKGTVSYTYDAAGNVASMTSSNANGIPVACQYDELRLKVRCCLQIRRDLVFVSSVLFTIALVSLVPPQVAAVRAMYPPASMELSGAWMLVARLGGERGVCSLTIILVALIVIWAGYVKRVRWTWFVMFTIVFGWAFAEFVLPWLWVWIGAPSKLLLSAVRGPSLAQEVVKGALVFSVMVIALFLPARAFFSRGRR